jgi:glycerophosphoryl diester phosphodiesterase
LGSTSLHADYRYFTAALVADIKAAGLMVLAYTVNDPDDAARLLAWGVDMICTDRIDLIRT